MSQPLVSFALRAYNQEHEIVRALRSVVEQNISFEAEIVVSIDHSSDGTFQAVKSFMKNLPSGFTPKVLYDGTRRGGVGNLCNVMQHCSGKYISWLDGDDYFIDPNKTQECVDFMENNLSIGLVYMDLQIESDYCEQPVLRKSRYLKDNQFDDLLHRNCFGTCSTVFRSNLLRHLNWEVLLESPSYAADDYFCWLEFSAHTKFAYIPKCTSAYSVNRTISNTSAKAVMDYDESTTNIRKYYIRKYPEQTAMTDFDVDQEHYRLQFDTSLRYNDASLARDAIANLPVPDSRKKRLIFTLCRCKTGFIIYLFYRKLKGLSSNEDSYFYH